MKHMELLTSGQVCERLHISAPTVTRWVKSGRLKPAMKLPGLRGPYLFDADYIATLMPDPPKREGVRWFANPGAPDEAAS